MTKEQLQVVAEEVERELRSASLKDDLKLGDLLIIEVIDGGFSIGWDRSNRRP